jgi:serine/threonine protein kinase
MGQSGEEQVKDYEAIIVAQQKKTGKVSAKDFVTKSVIGKGSYGKVLLVVKKDTNKMYALKILKKDEIIKRNQFEHTMAERRILVSRVSCALTFVLCSKV